jgi:hypothetical protein
VRWFAEKNIGWIDDSLDAADRLREEWRRKCATTTPPTATGGPEPL